MTFSFSKEQWEYIYKLGYPGPWDRTFFASEAIYRGGEALVQQNLKTDQYLPYNLEEIIEVGLKGLSDNIIHLKNAYEVADQVLDALKNKTGLSAIRLGDGEILALAHGILVSSEEINKNAKLKYALGGFAVPNHKKRDELTLNLLEADIVGIPEARYPTYQRLFNNLAKTIQLPLNQMNLTNSRINYLMNDETTLYHEILMNYRVLLIGNKAQDGMEFFKNLGYKNIVGAIPVPSIYEVPKVLEEVGNYEFDAAFVSAGIPANLICVDIAKRGKVAIDFGHLLDWYISGKKQIIQK
ncbi:GT-D fold domain-containing protein [Neobacillus drentensis]|uniref:GT-D fold domain-containing protein n=1 Tax=Neobacillus drentensis TaxID=220684 RepID=UPI002FFD9DE7